MNRLEEAFIVGTVARDWISNAATGDEPLHSTFTSGSKIPFCLEANEVLLART